MQRYRPLGIACSACLSGAILYSVGMVSPYGSILRGHGPAPVIVPVSQREGRQPAPTSPMMKMKELCSVAALGLAQTTLAVYEIAKTE